MPLWRRYVQRLIGESQQFIAGAWRVMQLTTWSFVVSVVHETTKFIIESIRPVFVTKHREQGRQTILMVFAATENSEATHVPTA
tara:strand:- start:49515 stop:49766 length:252 start_codon:yes stop_codon:yes gene_type:complete